jgi:ubiquinol-cytochrome c reductase cytochrome b subunit
MRKIYNTNFLLNVGLNHLSFYPTPKNISYFWGLGSLAGLCLVIQIITGVVLAMYYIPNVDYAFSSVEYIMRNVKNGWFIRYLHANGASMFFIVIYVHIGRGIYFKSYSYPRLSVWYSGVIIFILMMATAFLGYVLPWGQMSFWGATVITNFFTAIPIVGQSIAQWLWGGYAIGNPTLNRFFSLHFLLPFLIAGLALLHISMLHLEGSSNPLGTSLVERVGFYPYFYLKDFFGFLCMLFILCFLVFYYPNLLGHSDNYIPANALVTPKHIVPEWYFLPFYAILRAIPNKLLGIIAMFGAIILLVFIPFFEIARSTGARFKPLFKMVFFLMISNFLLLAWLGSQPIEYPFIIIGQIATFLYFFLFIVAIPLVGSIERCIFEL